MRTACCRVSLVFPISSRGCETLCGLPIEMSNETIRYAGKVRVRGMIRRVWRTRFIEIDSIGVLRYYETSEGSDNEECPAKIPSRINDESFLLKNETYSGETGRRTHASRRKLVAQKNEGIIIPEMQAFSLPVLFPEDENDDDDDYIQADCMLTRTEKNCNYGSLGVEPIHSTDGTERVNKTSKQYPDLPFQSDDDSSHNEGIVVTNHKYIDSKCATRNSSQIDAAIEETWDHLRSDKSVDCINNAGVDSISDAVASTDVISNKSATGIKDIHNLIQSQSHHIHGHRPKATILVRSARLLDPNSLRDMHLGLPKGKFGFMFHGCSIFNAANLEIQMSHSSDDICQSRFHFDDISDMSRDYLCAVNSLSEAENWLKALCWASSTTREYERKWRERHIEMNDDDDVSDSLHHMGVFQNLRSYNRKNLVGDITPEDRSLFMGSSQSLDSVDSTFGSVIIHDDKSKMDCIIVIPKVTDIRYVPKRKRLLGVKLDVLAEIHILVNKSFPSSENIYEYTIFRSISDIENFFASLEGIKFFDQSTSRYDIKSKAAASSIDRDTVIINELNSMLRELVSNRTVCNSEKVKDFLLLTHNMKNSLLPAVTKHGEAFTRFTDIQSRDDFVKKWINQAPSQKIEKFQDKKILIFLLLQDFRVEFILTLLSAYGLFRISCWWWYKTAISVTVRLDYLLLTYFGSCFYAYKMGHQKSRIRIKRDKGTIIESSDNGAVEPISSSDIASTAETAKIRDDSASVPQLSQQAGSAVDSIWSKPDDSLFKVRGPTYLKDRTKIPSHKAPFDCLAVDIYLTDNPERNIARHDFVYRGNAPQEDLLVVNFLLPFANFIAIFRVPPLTTLAPNVAGVWTRFIQGDQQYRDSRLKMLPVVVEGPWIVKKAVGHGTAPALLGKVIPLQYFFSKASPTRSHARYEIDIIITASRIAHGILNVVKGHTKNMSIAFAFIIEGVTAEELPETVLCSFQLNSVHLEKCPQLPDHDITESDYE